MLARLLLLRGLEPTVFERDRHATDRPQGGSLDLHGDTGQRAMRIAGLEKEFSTAARPEDQGDRLYDQKGTLLFDRDGAGDDRPEIDRTALRQILLNSLPPGMVRWSSKVESVLSHADGGCEVVAGGAAERFDVVVGADGAWSQVRSILTDAIPRYEDVTLVEFGFDAQRHANVDALVGSGKMFAVGDNRVLIAQRNGHGHLRGYAGLRLAENTAREWTMDSARPRSGASVACLRGLGVKADIFDRMRRFHSGQAALRAADRIHVGEQTGHHFAGRRRPPDVAIQWRGGEPGPCRRRGSCRCAHLRRRLAGGRGLRDRDHGARQAGCRRSCPKG